MKDFELVLQQIEAILELLVEWQEVQSYHLITPSLFAVIEAIKKIENWCQQEDEDATSKAQRFKEWSQSDHVVELWRRLLVNSEYAAILTEWANYQEYAQIHIKVKLLIPLMSYVPVLRSQINTLLLTFKNPHIHGYDFSFVPRSRSKADLEELQRFNEALYRHKEFSDQASYTSDPHIKGLWLLGLCDRILAYRDKARLLASPFCEWPLGSDFIHQLLHELKSNRVEPILQLWIRLIALLNVLNSNESLPTIRDILFDNQWDKISSGNRSAVQIYHAIVQLNIIFQTVESIQDVTSLLSKLIKVLQSSKNEFIPAISKSNLAVINMVFNNDYAARLNTVWNSSYTEFTILKAQLKFSQFVSEMLNDFLNFSQLLLGVPLCVVVFLLFGSTSQGKRGRYSDIEGGLIYKSSVVADEYEYKAQAYLHSLLRLFEWCVTFLNETPCKSTEQFESKKNDSRSGIRLDVKTKLNQRKANNEEDSSDHEDSISIQFPALTPVMTVDELIWKYIKSMKDNVVDIPRNEDYFSLLCARFVNRNNDDSSLVYQEYKQQVELSLNENISLSMSNRSFFSNNGSWLLCQKFKVCNRLANLP